jgi:hypothetical protein
LGFFFMKRTLLAVVTLGLFLPFAQVSKGIDVSVDFFYNNMSGGSWMEVADYGYCWQPDIVVSNTSWRPYSDGYWTYTDLGWTWVSYEDFGWATYHYGRWVRLADHGWCWAPGRDEDLEWGPAWVSWRTSDTYVGWAPLPPTRIRFVEGVAITGQVDIEFDIGPGYYNFCDVRYIGEPVLRERIVDVNQNVTFINQTVNVTNITYKNKVVYNYGPDINVINTRAARPIQRLKIERQENVDVNVAMKSGNLLKPQGDKLVVAAPMHIKKSEKMMAPPNVKTKVEKAKVDKGWAAVGDEKAQTEFKQKIKAQDLHKIPKGDGAGAAGANAAAGAETSAAGPQGGQFGKGKGKGKHGEEPGAAGSAGTSAETTAVGPQGGQFGKGKGKGKHGEEPGAAGSAGAGAETSAAGPQGGQFGKGKGKGKHGEEPGAAGSAAPGATEETSSFGHIIDPSHPPEDTQRKKGKHKEGGPVGGPTTTESVNPQGSTGSPEFGRGRKGKRADETTTAPSAESAGPAATETGPGKHKGKKMDQGQPPMGGGQGAETQGGQGAGGGGGGKHKGHDMQPTNVPPGNVAPANVAPQGGAAPGGAEPKQGKGEGKKHKGEASPVPSP